MRFFYELKSFFYDGGIAVVLSNLADLLIIAALIYCVLYFLKGTKSANVLAGVIAILLVVGLVARYFNLVTLSYLMNGLWTIIGIAIVVLFQPELRRVFAQAGSLFTLNRANEKTVDEVINSVVQMAVTKTGALIVFERKIGLAGIVNQAYKLDCKISSPLLQTIFFKNSPLHDCAVIIRDNRIIAAHAVLPLSQKLDMRLGTRHRAAIGITEETDAVAVVVSEETGYISLANKGNIMRRLSPDELKEWLAYLLVGKNKNIPALNGGEIRSHTGKTEGGSSGEQGDLFDGEDF